MYRNEYNKCFLDTAKSGLTRQRNSTGECKVAPSKDLFESETVLRAAVMTGSSNRLVEC